jgi:hypothetical protein
MQEKEKEQEIKESTPPQKENWFYMWTGRRWVLTQSVRQYRN